MLVQVAWAASHARGTYLRAQYQRLAAGRGKKRAIVALAHTILVIIYHLLKDGACYKDLGYDYFDRLAAQAKARYYQRRLEELTGMRVCLAKPEVA